MVTLPPYMKLVVNNAPSRRHDGTSKVDASRKVETSRDTSDAGGEVRERTSSGLVLGQDSVELGHGDYRRNIAGEIPTKEEAEDILQGLQGDLKDMGRSVGNLHSKLDRRAILSLLAPLVYE